MSNFQVWWHRHQVGVWLIILFLTAIAIFGWFAIGEMNRRAHLLGGGSHIAAIVTKSDDDNSRHTCIVEFRYAPRWPTVTYDGSVLGCAIMQAHPVGSHIDVLYDPADPADSITAGSSKWTPAIGAYVFCACALSALIVLFIFGIVRKTMQDHANPPDDLW